MLYEHHEAPSGTPLVSPPGRTTEQGNQTSQAGAAVALGKAPKAISSPLLCPQAMESKLLIGGRNIMDHTNEQQKMLELKRQEIAEQVGLGASGS